MKNDKAATIRQPAAIPINKAFSLLITPPA
jgi:hypothetical protein